MSNIHSLSSVKKSAPKNPNDSKNEEFSVGGKSSATAVMRPTNGSDRPSMPNPSAGGAGFSPADLVRMAREQKDGPVDAANVGPTITLYSNGFIVGDGEFRDIRVPENAKFLAELKKGEIPVEMEKLVKQQMGGAESIGVNLVDRTSEAFKAPAAKFDFSQSSGQSLQSSSNNENSNSAASSFQSARPLRITVNSAAATGVVQILTADRKRIRETFNETNTVLELYQHVMAITGSTTAMQLVAGFPPKPLTDPTLTLKEAGLLNSQVQIR